METTVRLRDERPGDDADAIRELLIGCFAGDEEAALVDRLRRDGDIALSLLAEIDGEIAAHVLFSRMRAPRGALGLGPVATRGDWRRMGLAGRLISAGLAEAARQGWTRAFVLGDPRFYGRFGFEPAASEGFAGPFAGPHFMVTRLGAVGAQPPGTPCRYPAAYDALGAA